MKNKSVVINVLGTGCPNCIKLENNTKKAIEDLHLEVAVNKITDIEDIMSYGVMSTPALAIDDKIICSGRVPDVEEIKKMFEEVEWE